MAIERTDISKFKSPNCGDFCTGEQYIAEVVMARKHEKNNEKLPFKFWNIDKYKKEFIKNIIAANRLTKLYDVDIIVKVLNTTGTWITFLYGNAIYDLIDKEIDKQSKENKEFNLEIGNIEALPKTTKEKKSMLGKLK